MKQSITQIAAIVFVFSPFLVGNTIAQSTTVRSDWAMGYQLRSDSLVHLYADRIDPDDFSTGGYREIIAKLMLKEDIPWAMARMDSLLKTPSGDMFWMYPVATIQYLGRDLFPQDFQDRIRDSWRTYMPYRGDTENHWAMYYTSLYLVSQLYPDLPGEAWFTGKSSAENMFEAKEYLISWMNLAVTIGQGEYDSPDYLGVYISPMAMLYGFVEDPELKLRAQMMLEVILADFAVDSLNGLYTGAHSRVYPAQVLEQWISTSTSFAWLLFGNVVLREHPEPLQLIASGFQLPEVIYRMATERDNPFVHLEKKRTRHRIRYSDLKNAPVYKYSYMNEAYALGSSQGGLLQPIQQQTWDLTWSVPDPRGVHNTFFSIHPYSSSVEGAMYFAEHEELVTELIVRSKTTFASPDKWTGGSPYENVFQHEDALIALYDIPVGELHPHVGVFFSDDIEAREIDPSGWIFCRAGDVFFAWYPMAPYEWIKEPERDWRLHSPHLKNGGVLQVAYKQAYGTFAQFKEAVRSLPLRTSLSPVPSVSFTTLGGDRLVHSFDGTPSVNGVPVDFDAWPLYEGPYMEAAAGSKVIVLKNGPVHRELDFNKPSIREWVEN